MLSCGSVRQYEGYWATVKPDRLAGGLPTGGYGETEGAKLGETHDKKYWADRLSRRLADEYDAGMGECCGAYSRLASRLTEPSGNRTI